MQQTEIGVMSGHIAALETTVAQLDKSVAVLCSQVDHFQAGVDEAHTDHRKLSDRLNAVERRVDALVTGVDTLNAQLSKFILGLDRAQQTDAIIAARVDALEAQGKVETARDLEGARLVAEKESENNRRVSWLNLVLTAFMALIAIMEVLRTFHLV